MKVKENNPDFPMRITDEYWINTTVRKTQHYPRKFKQDKSGKWLVFTENINHNNTWQIIKKATINGLLGVGAKAATAKINPNANSENEKVICVYTYNWLDINDVYRVESALRKIGIIQTLFYKTDSDSLCGKYKNNGSNNISKYVSKAIKCYKEHGLFNLHGVGYDKIEILKKIGIKNLDDLLAFDTSKKLFSVGISTERINKLKLSALSQIENKIYKLTTFEFPIGETIHFDIETDLSNVYSRKKVWSIAIHHNKKTKRFFAETWEQERNILVNFLDYIKKAKDPFLISYSGMGFDKNILAGALKRHKLDFEYFLKCNHYDLCTYLRQNYVLPIGSYSLKPVGKYFGYKFKHENLNGKMVAQQYIDCQMTGKKLPKFIFNYIDDDVKSMHFILNKLRQRNDVTHLI